MPPIHMNGRVYDPNVGRFLSPDILVQAPDNTQSFNRYAYVFNNPLRYTDPTGYEGCDAVHNCSVLSGSLGTSMPETKLHIEVKDGAGGNLVYKSKDGEWKDVSNLEQFGVSVSAVDGDSGAGGSGGTGQTSGSPEGATGGGSAANNVSILAQESNPRDPRRAWDDAPEELLLSEEKGMSRAEMKKAIFKEPELQRASSVQVGSIAIMAGPKWVPLQLRPTQSLGQYGRIAIPRTKSAESLKAFKSRQYRLQQWQRGETHTGGGRGLPNSGKVRNPWNSGEGGTGGLLENIIKTMEYLGGGAAVSVGRNECLPPLCA